MKRCAFSLVELIVVSALIVVLLALLMPAMQAGRESARRVGCGENLRQIGFGLLAYHDRFGSFPPGWIHSPIERQECWGWGALVLPFLEERAVYEELRVTRGSLHRQLATRGATVVPLARAALPRYRCPADSGLSSQGQVHRDRHFSDGLGFLACKQAGPFLPAVSNYVGVAGHCDVVGDAANSGVLFGDSYIRLSDVSDGTSHTLLVGERETLFCRSGTWLGTRSSTSGTARGSVVVAGHSRPKLNQPDPPLAWNTDRLGCGEGFSSLHEGGALFLTCDGATHFIAEGIDHHWYAAGGPAAAGSLADAASPVNGIYQKLMTRNDRQPVSVF
jgi:hypothetical protein